MATHFDRTMRALAADHGRPSAWLWAVAGLLALAWCAWFARAEVTLIEASTLAHVASQADGKLFVQAEFSPDTAFGRLQPGQPARLMLQAFPWIEHGSVVLRVAAVQPPRAGDGSVQVTLSLPTHNDTATNRRPPPLQAGLAGRVEVEIARLSPMALLWRRLGHDVQAPDRVARAGALQQAAR